ncbi:MAG: DUF421 domain-containing protein [Syntrophomonadaceae bacterium]|nr:DUF421 domain-containing protein [Syntrophomonadaceae bacterium]
MPEWSIILLRVIGVLFLTLLLVRMPGRKSLSRLSPFELISVLVIGFTAALWSLNLIGDLLTIIIALAVWVLIPQIFSILSLKSKKFRDIYRGQETILVHQGKVLEEKLLREKLSPEDLLSMLRSNRVFNFADIEMAVLEPDGELNLLLRKEQQPLTPHSIGIPMLQEQAPQTVLIDGNIMEEKLAALGLNRHWLLTELIKLGVAVENVFMGQVDSAGQLYLDLFDDQIKVPQPTIKEMTRATLNKCQADLELFSLSSRADSAKKVYSDAARDIKNISTGLESLLSR